MRFARPLQPGDYVVFHATKHSAHPGARARDIRPEPRGEGYLYTVDKFWIVNERRGSHLVLTTRRDKVHVVDADDPHLERASWWQRWVHRDRFPNPQTSSAQNRLTAQKI